MRPCLPVGFSRTGVRRFDRCLPTLETFYRYETSARGHVRVSAVWNLHLFALTHAHVAVRSAHQRARSCACAARTRCISHDLPRRHTHTHTHTHTHMRARTHTDTHGSNTQRCSSPRSMRSRCPPSCCVHPEERDVQHSHGPAGLEDDVQLVAERSRNVVKAPTNALPCAAATHKSPSRNTLYTSD